MIIRRIINYARNDFWDFLSWVAFVIGVVYVFLKVRGILHSPVISDVIGIGSVAYFLASQHQETKHIKNDLMKLDRNVEKLSEEIHELKYDFRSHCSKKSH